MNEYGAVSALAELGRPGEELDLPDRPVAGARGRVDRDLGTDGNAERSARGGDLDSWRAFLTSTIGATDGTPAELMMNNM